MHKPSETKYVNEAFIWLFFVSDLSLQISALMDKFENQFETLDVQTAQMEDTMGNTTTLTTPQVISAVILQPGELLWIIIIIIIIIQNIAYLLITILVPRMKWIHSCMRWLMKQGEYLQTI